MEFFPFLESRALGRPRKERCDVNAPKVDDEMDEQPFCSLRFSPSTTTGEPARTQPSAAHTDTALVCTPTRGGELNLPEISRIASIGDTMFLHCFCKFIDRTHIDMLILGGS
ncbi:uncharacterized protein LOC110179591 [Drosophila serrata]|uniref:uncharacterized protein LOC110179591 n=1 Tax=Drosophila serrata TaxID=7274 RepID=UPI000A1D126E|nr:uncharacterized protein LOC110179591 [Drosophila serrata]